ncbi:MAG: phosphotransferase-like protein [Bdellovibrionota bacterium]
MIVFLNGSSSSGKSTLARALQELLLPACWLNFSIDSVMYTLPPSVLARMTSGASNPGLDFPRLEEAFYRAAREIAAAGWDLILDHAVVTAESASMFRSRFEGVPCLMVGLDCALDELRRRERARGDRGIGEAEAQAPLVHRHFEYDLRVNTSSEDPTALARQIQELL